MKISQHLGGKIYITYCPRAMSRDITLVIHKSDTIERK